MYTYNSTGTLKTRTDFNGRTTTYDYDNLNRLLSKTADPYFAQHGLGATVVSFTYTADGRRETMTDASGKTTYTYDPVSGRLTSKQTPEGTLNYEYDSAGNVKSIASSNTNGAAMAYTYDELNRLSTVTVPGQSPTTYSYDEVGNLGGYTYPNGVATSYTYDKLNRLTDMSVRSAGSAGLQTGNAIASYSYTLGAAGNRTKVVELSGRTVEYGYDNLYRLTSETITGDLAGKNGVVGYSYDAVGNRKERTSTLEAVPASGLLYYDANDRTSTDTYDDNGNTISQAGIDNAYDFENRLVKHGAMTFTYDGDGNRVAKTVGGVTTQFLVDTANPTGYSQVIDELTNGTASRAYAYGLDLISQSQNIDSARKTSWYGYDGHGSVRVLTDDAGAVTDTYTYDAFGNVIGQTGNTPNNYLFAGEQYDWDLGLYYNRARYMDVRVGRFWGMDTEEGDDDSPASLHKYQFVEDNPVDNLDISGWGIVSNLIYGQKVHDAIGAAFEGSGPLRLYDNSIKKILGYSVPGLSRFRPDLVDVSTGEIYEIKPVGVQEVAGYAQLTGYLIMLNLSDNLQRVWMPGESFQHPQLPEEVPLGGDAVAMVYPPLAGLITYEVISKTEIAVESVVAFTIVATMAALKLTVGVATLNTVMCPAAP